MKKINTTNNLSLYANRELLRLATAGSVDDGKSTLIGRLFFDCHSIYDDQLAGIKKNSLKNGLKGVDLSLFTDGLSAEMEQGITIDVAYKYLDTLRRRVIIADVPGHEQYTRNMITGVSEADAVLILIDASRGLTIQSKRHLFLSSLLDVPHIIVAVNKMDLVDYSQDVFEKIKNDFSAYADKLNIKDLKYIPISALNGDMIVARGNNMPWYGGDTILYYIENIPCSSRNLVDLRLPVQMVIRNENKFRGYAGRLESGIIKTGDEIITIPSEKKAKIKSIIVGGKKVSYAFSPQSVVVNLSREIDISRGDFIVRENNRPEINYELDAMLCNLSDKILSKGKSYFIKLSASTARIQISSIHYCLNVKTLHREKNSSLGSNGIGRVLIKSNDKLIFDYFQKNKNTGSFVLIDELSKDTVAAGVILDKGKIPQTKNRKEVKTKNKPAPVLWFTGLSGSGKSAIADEVHKVLINRNIDSERLDGDMLRKKMNADLGFSPADRNKNIERASYIASILSRHRVTVLATFISPYKKSRQIARSNIKNFIEIFVDTPLEVCEIRDTKGLYKKARNNRINNFTGISDKYEIPNKPDIHLKTSLLTVKKCADIIIDYLDKRGLLG